MTGQKSTIAITGVTGKLGGTVATGLQDLVPQLRLLVRDAGRAPRLEGGRGRDGIRRRGGFPQGTDRG